jgi:hypothetical protein
VFPGRTVGKQTAVTAVLPCLQHASPTTLPAGQEEDQLMSFVEKYEKGEWNTGEGR